MPLSCWIALLQKKLVIVPVTFFCVFVFLSVNLTDGCLKETGTLPPASFAHCRWAYKAVQAESREAAVPELSVGLEAHRLVCLTRSLFVFSFAVSAVHQYLLAAVSLLLCLQRGLSGVFCQCTWLHSCMQPCIRALKATGFSVCVRLSRSPVNVNGPSRLFAVLAEP